MAEHRPLSWARSRLPVLCRHQGRRTALLHVWPDFRLSITTSRGTPPKNPNIRV
jgi:hypothetical protein